MQQKTAQDYVSEFMALLPPGFPAPSPLAVFRAALALKKQEENLSQQEKSKRSDKNAAGAALAATLGIPVARRAGEWAIQQGANYLTAPATPEIISAQFVGGTGQAAGAGTQAASNTAGLSALRS